MALPEFVLERRFNASRELVWRSWTEADLLARWYGPGVETVIHKLDVTPGGLWLNEMRMGGGSHYQRVEYTEVIAPEKLVWLHSVADAAWNIAANPMMPDWPRVLLTTVTFLEEGDETVVRLVWAPHEASEAEISCFAGAISGLDKGWGKGMDLLAELLEELQA
ncbi:SRPBCC family protein [Roseibium sediminicola]|uniref:SRPBCC domain-containing protein n=1 Tax=Roseibium sediminicola TaxID=2933272 RepID=A0ABT0GPX3_9HYPH|nr:SRPBCC domain-containing protein [Roseibium sp. CAU 1639]MCK7610915.1 SRPBCC domain-containing protein [Roseibium sp. CAU 1639]